MTNRAKDRLINSVISLGLIVATVLANEFIKNKNNASDDHDKNIKTEVKEEVKKELKPEIDKKLDTKVFEIHVASQDNKIEALEKKHDSEYNALINKIDDYAKNVDSRFGDIKSLIEANNK